MIWHYMWFLLILYACIIVLAYLYLLIYVCTEHFLSIHFSGKFFMYIYNLSINYFSIYALFDLHVSLYLYSNSSARYLHLCPILSYSFISKLYSFYCSVFYRHIMIFLFENTVFVRIIIFLFAFIALSFGNLCIFMH